MAVSRAAVHWLDWGLWRDPLLAPRLGVPLSIVSGLIKQPSKTAYIGWGLKSSGRRARTLAKRDHCPCWLLEDGFIRSLGPSNCQSLSLIIDSVGIYYDASRPSLLEALVQRPLGSTEIARARRLIDAWRENRISKYNNARDIEISRLPTSYVLVVDQTAGDASIAGGFGNAAMFNDMLLDALTTYSNSQVVLKLHPEVVAGRKAGHFDIAALSAAYPRVQVIADDIHPAVLLSQSVAVYTVTSQIGFEALLWGKPVHVYGMPFYAGWGLTQDKQARPERRRDVTLEQLVHAALVDYSRYFDPHTGIQCDVEILIDWLGFQRKQRARFPPNLKAYGFSKWKQNFVQDFLAGSEVEFVNTLPPEDRSAYQLVVWGHKHTEELAQQGYASNALRIEDGFIRSVGLGADFIRPLSWVIDPIGIYYDAHRPSELERLLATGEFSTSLINRAANLRNKLVKNGITKYNLGDACRWQRPDGVNKVALVIGQVETDAAIKYGASTIRRNIDLLKAVRQACPNAWLVYKAHPDVVAGLRCQGEDEASAKLWCDEWIGDIPLDGLLSMVDEVHVLSSLAGFEALLRGIPVVTWGQPFYAGWGLTIDAAITPEVAARRTRRLTLDELVAATLILYPTYVSRKTHYFCTPEQIVDELKQWRTEVRSQPLRRLVARVFRKP